MLQGSSQEYQLISAPDVSNEQNPTMTNVEHTLEMIDNESPRQQERNVQKMMEGEMIDHQSRNVGQGGKRKLNTIGEDTIDAVDRDASFVTASIQDMHDMLSTDKLPNDLTTSPKYGNDPKSQEKLNKSDQNIGKKVNQQNQK